MSQYDSFWESKPPIYDTWVVMPNDSGCYWFCEKLEDKDLSVMVGVSKIQYNCDPPFLARSHGNERPITPDDGWWLRIPDHRMTAKVENAATQ